MRAHSLLNVIDGLGELLLQRWAGGAAESPTPVYGPQGVARVIEGLNLAYAADRQYRVAHHGNEVVPPSGAGARARPFAAPPEIKMPMLGNDTMVSPSTLLLADWMVSPFSEPLSELPSRVTLPVMVVPPVASDKAGSSLANEIVPPREKLMMSVQNY